jgi:methenyltetrahydrofolate cyclohydrolase
VALAQETVAALLGDLAAKTAAPGAGTAAALAGASAAALTEMASAFALARAPRHDVAADTQRRASELRAWLLELGDADVRSYQPVLDALALDPSDSRRAPALATALSNAAEAPLQIAAASSEVAELAAAVARAPANEQLLGEASAAAIIAEAATRAAVALVELNLASSPADPRTEQGAALAARARAARASLAGEAGG